MIYQYNNYLIHKFDEITSSNDVAFELFDSKKIFANEVIWASSQNKGRGRSNKIWESPKGNLYFSLTLKPNKSINIIPQISYVAICALNQSITYFFTKQNLKFPIQNKWPNDLIINNSKVAGILLESKIINDKCDIVVMGIGVNLVQNPSNDSFKSANILQFGCIISPQDLLENFLDNFRNLYNNWLNFGFVNIKKLWLDNAFNLDKIISIKLNDKNISGFFKKLDDEGNMLINQDGNILKINFGEIINFNN